MNEVSALMWYDNSVLMTFLGEGRQTGQEISFPRFFVKEIEEE